MKKAIILSLTLAFVALMTLSAAAQQGTISVTLAESEYAIDESIGIRVQLPAQTAAMATIEVDDPSGNPVLLLTNQTDANGAALFTFTLGDGADIGEYTICASANYTGTVLQSSSEVRISYPAPLTIDPNGITFSKLNPSINEETWIYAVVRNNSTAIWNAEVAFYDNGTQIGGIQNIRVPPMEVEVARMEWTPLNNGYHDISVSVDCGLDFKEDTASTEIEVGGSSVSTLVLDVGDMNVYRFEPGEERTISVDVTCYLATVHNVHLVCLDNQNLTIDTTITPPRIMNDGDTIVFYMKIKAPLQTRRSASEYDLIIQVAGDGVYSNAESLDIIIVDSALSMFNLATVGTATTAIGLTAAGYAVSRNESWKYWFLSALIAPLYVRLKRGVVLDHFVRGQIFGHIKTNPGTHYNQIKDVLGVANGVLAHHLRTLEREEFIKSRTDGKLKRFYPAEMNIEIDKNGIQLSEPQLEIIDIIRQNPGTTQSDIARNMNKDRRAIGYHIKQLERMNVIRLEKSGRECFCYLVESHTGPGI